MKHNRVFHRGFTIAKDHEPLWCAQNPGFLPLDCPAREKPGLLHVLATGANRSDMVPRGHLPPGQGQIDRLDFTAVRADVGLPIFKVL